MININNLWNLMLMYSVSFFDNLRPFWIPKKPRHIYQCKYKFYWRYH